MGRTQTWTVVVVSLSIALYFSAIVVSKTDDAKKPQEEYDHVGSCLHCSGADLFRIRILVREFL